MELKPIVAEKLIQIFEKITGKSIYDFHGSTQAKKINIPVMIIHDENDKEVPMYDAINNHKYLKNGQLLQTKGLGHTRILKDDKVVSAIINFIVE
jgi:pimeloyl-ACP methyl ester carboxylesterase